MKKIKYKCIIWGIGEDYERIINQVHFEQSKGNIEVLAAVCRKDDRVGSSIDGIPLISSEELGTAEFDYIIVASSLYYTEIVDEIKKLNVDEEKIIDGRVFRNAMFDFSLYVSLKKNRITILSDDCWGGHIYHSLYMKFYSPLVNMYWDESEYIRFIKKPEFYLKQPLECERDADVRGNSCAIGSLGTGKDKVRMRLVHSLSFEDAKRKWDSRVSRINLNNLFVKIAIDASDKDAQYYIDEFSTISHRKICFYSGFYGGRAYI